MMTRTLPNFIEGERALLGAMMMKEDIAKDLLTSLSQDDFYHPQHKIIFEIIQEIVNKGNPITAMMVTKTLQDFGRLIEVGGAPYVLEVYESVTTIEHTDHYLGLVKEYSVRRKFLEQADKMLESAYDETSDIQKTMDEYRAEFNALEMTNSKRDYKSVVDLIDGAINRITEPEKYQQNGLKTGFPKLDELIGGLCKGELIIIAARPSMGKSTFALNIAKYVAQWEKAHVAIVSLEMPNEQLISKLIDNVGLQSFSNPSLNLKVTHRHVLDSAKATLAQMKIHFDDTPALELSQIKIRAKQLHKKQPLDLIVIDYLQLIHYIDYKNNRTQEITKISSGLKELARELEIPIIALSQLSRNVEHRQSKVPLLSDLRDSGSIEQDADKVLMIYRDDYYKEKDVPRDRITDIFVRKNRNGRTGSVKLTFRGDISTFENIKL